MANKLLDWIEDRTGLVSWTKKNMEHPVPKTATWWYVFGSATLFCFILQVVTGVGLALLYQPSSSTAYPSLLYIENEAVLGSWLRGIHYFGASGMILFMGIHMIRTYIMAAFKYPRELSWVSGVCLLVLTVMMGFTGQLLRWDDTGVWSAVVAAEQMGRFPFVGKRLADFLLGGETIGGQTLSRFFGFHVFLIPAFLFLFVAFHVYLVFRNGISEPPKRGRILNPKTYKKWYEELLHQEGVPFFPFAAWRDVLFGVTVILGILAFGYWIGAPHLKGPPDPAFIYVAPRPDWYLIWIFAVFALMPADIESYMIILAPLLIFAILFAIPFLSNGGERHALRRPWAIAGVVFTVTMVATFWRAGILAPWSPRFKTPVFPASLTMEKQELVKQGSHLFYSAGCLYCHKINNLGGVRGPDLTTIQYRLTEQEMVIRIINGGKNMPAFGGSINEDELNAIIAFLESDKRQRGGSKK